MKAGPVLAMILLSFLGMWLVLHPSVTIEKHDFDLKIGSVDLAADRTENGWRFVGNDELEARGELTPAEFLGVIDAEIIEWDARPPAEQALMGFFNISGWHNLVWIVIGLGGQLAFFGRMLVQWIKSEKERESVVPEMFWWLSLIGGICLFTYFVWRKDFVGVLGQSTGVVIYARNLRLIRKQHRRSSRTVPIEHEADQPAADPAPEPGRARPAGAE